MPKPPKLRVTFIKPDAARKFVKRRPTYEEVGIKFDLSQFYALKASLEGILGYPIYLKLKDYAPIKEWRKALIRLLDAIELAISSTVQIADQEWRDDISEILQMGRDRIRDSETSSALFAGLSATLTQVVFLQIGLLPSRPFQGKTAPLTADYWTLNYHRSVQYVQTDTQKQAAANVSRERALPARDGENDLLDPVSS